MRDLHEFMEDVDDYSMCICGVPADQHWRVEPDREIGCGGVLEVPDEIRDALLARVTPEMQAKQDAARERIRERNARLLGTDRENGSSDAR